MATTHNFHYENVKLARRRKVFLMEAMWTRFLPAICQVREWLAAGVIGELRQIRADFGFNAPFDPEGRMYNKALAGGALLDAGIYPISFASMVAGPPAAVRAHVEVTAKIIGSEGIITVPQFLRATEAELHRFEEGETIHRSFPYPAGQGFEFETREVVDCIREGKLESSVMPLDESVAIMRTMDTIRGKIGLVYENDK